MELFLTIQEEGMLCINLYIYYFLITYISELFLLRKHSDPRYRVLALKDTDIIIAPKVRLYAHIYM